MKKTFFEFLQQYTTLTHKLFLENKTCTVHRDMLTRKRTKDRGPTLTGPSRTPHLGRNSLLICYALIVNIRYPILEYKYAPTTVYLQSTKTNVQRILLILQYYHNSPIGKTLEMMPGAPTNA